MGLAALQPVLARLYADPAFRETFFTDPPAAGRAAGLSGTDVDQIIALDAAQVRFYAESLIGKRRGEVRDLLPLSCRALGSRFAPLFRRHAQHYVPAGIKRHRDDALAFAAFVCRLWSDDDAKREMDAPWWTGEVFRYERAWLLAADPNRRWWVERFDHDIADIVALAKRDEESILPRRPCTLFWVRPIPGGRLYVLTLRESWRLWQSTLCQIIL